MTPHMVVCACGRLTDHKPCATCRSRANRKRNSQPHRVAHRSTRHARLRRKVFARDGHACVDCGTTTDLTLDYLVPLQHGGAMTSSNAETRCRRCNTRRYNHEQRHRTNQ